MIPKEAVDEIINTARIDEVVGDFITLKKRGVNMLGLCPFHNERTPSFTVSPVKGIYKCFGCGKAGNSVNFIMEHEHATYPEALKYLAGKYHIAIEEKEITPEDIAAQNEKESLFIVTAFAAKFFQDQLWETEKGQAIGLTYFEERGFEEATIRKFELGYAPDSWDSLTSAALEAGYNIEYLDKAGFTIRNETKQYDRFRGRVMFPIHNLTGKVIAFGGRILQSDPKSPKYINSPESEIYHKSKVLYGISQARKAIQQHDTCNLVEGYTDVVSLHQSGVENVVASSGTSLTVEQIRLIGRYTKNVTVLYDGDTAGIKASLRGIDLILEEGLNVKCVLFPEGEDPDSMARRLSAYELQKFITDSAVDFILFKTGLLLEDTANDPVKKGALIRDIIESIARIPDTIIATAYVQQCARKLEINEQILFAELQRIKRKSIKQRYGEEPMAPPPTPDMQDDVLELVEENPLDYIEKDLIRLMLNYGNHEVIFHDDTNPREPKETKYKVSKLVIEAIQRDGLEFKNAVYEKVFTYFSDNESETDTDVSALVNEADEEVQQLCIELMSTRHELSENWEAMHKIAVPEESALLKRSVISVINKLRLQRVRAMIREVQLIIKDTADEDQLYVLLEKQKKLNDLKSSLSNEEGITVMSKH